MTAAEKISKDIKELPQKGRMPMNELPVNAGVSVWRRSVPGNSPVYATGEQTEAS